MKVYKEILEKNIVWILNAPTIVKLFRYVQHHTMS